MLLMRMSELLETMLNHWHQLDRPFTSPPLDQLTNGGFRILRLDMVPPSRPLKAKSTGLSSCLVVSKKSQVMEQDTNCRIGLNLLPVRLAMPINQRLVIPQITIDVDILSAPLPERRCILEGILEALLGPVIHVRIVKVNFPSNDHVYVPQKGKVERGRNPVHLIQHDSTAVIATLKRLEDARRRVVAWVAAGGDPAESVVSWRGAWHLLASAIRPCLEERSLGYAVWTVCQD